jgi:glucose-1-phosphate thymidylyltransferase
VLIISTERDTPRIKELLGGGHQFGLNIEYAVQQAPRGLPEAFVIGESFIAGHDVMLVLGDNIFYGNFDFLRRAIQSQTNKEGGFRGRIFGYNVEDPRRYGVAEIEKGTKRVLSLEEKPQKPKSNFAIPGLYIFDDTAAARSKDLRPSARGEIEITDLMKSYLNENLLCAEIINRGVAWLDAGTPESLLEASQFIAAIEHRQGLKVACLEEIAIRQGFFEGSQLDKLLERAPKGPYRNYLERVIEEIE